ncbi:protein of unknown function [Pararobbsia alpina]
MRMAAEIVGRLKQRDAMPARQKIGARQAGDARTHHGNALARRHGVLCRVHWLDLADDEPVVVVAGAMAVAAVEATVVVVAMDVAAAEGVVVDAGVVVVATAAVAGAVAAFVTAGVLVPVRAAVAAYFNDLPSNTCATPHSRPAA